MSALGKGAVMLLGINLIHRLVADGNRTQDFLFPEEGRKLTNGHSICKAHISMVMLHEIKRHLLQP